MARQNIMDLKRTSSTRHWPSKAPAGVNGERFETLADAHAEERIRRRSGLMLISFGGQPNLFSNRSALLLIKRLDYKRRGKGPPRSGASSVYMRRLRDRMFSHLAELVRNYPGKVTTFTAIKRGWEFKPEHLLSAEPDKLLAGFLSDLNRRGAADADGWVAAFLHGEYETPTGIFRLHLHGIVAGGMIGVVDRLRSASKYKYKFSDNVRFRLRIARKPLNNLPHSLTYCLKSYWPWKHVSAGAHGERRTRRHKRIPEPYHTLVLQFLDRHSPNELVLLKHISVVAGQLKPSSQRRAV